MRVKKYIIGNIDSFLESLDFLKGIVITRAKLPSALSRTEQRDFKQSNLSSETEDEEDNLGVPDGVFHRIIRLRLFRLLAPSTNNVIHVSFYNKLSEHERANLDNECTSDNVVYLKKQQRS